MVAVFKGGLARAFLSYYDTTGAWIGTSTTLSNGSTSSAYVIDQARAAALAFVDPATLRQQGGDKRGQALMFGVPQFDTFEVQVDEHDTALFTMADKAAVNTGNSQITKQGFNTNRSTPVLAGIAFQQQYTNNGVAGFFTLFFPKCQIAIRPGAFQFQGESLTTLNVTPMMTTTAHTGQTFGTSGLAFTYENDEGQAYAYFTAYPIHITTQRSDAAATTFTTAYRPISSTVTLNATLNDMHKNGTATALSSISTTTGVATLAAAGTAGDVHVLTYGTEFVPI